MYSNSERNELQNIENDPIFKRMAKDFQDQVLSDPQEGIG